MKRVERSEILDLGAYEQVRPRYLDRIITMKKNRRVAVGEHMTFIFENHDTVLFQIQEMVRTERMTRDAAIQDEIDTYNELVPGEGELFATLMIEYEPEGRRESLDRLRGLGDHVVMHVGNREAKAVFEPLPGEEPGRVPSISYLRFVVGADAAKALRDASQTAALEVTHPSYQARTDLPAAVRTELASDLEAP